MTDKTVAMLTDESWTDELDAIRYAIISFRQMTEEQSTAEVEKVGTGYMDWVDSLAMIGTIGMYDADSVKDLDTITGCTEHTELGKSSDGAYTYYLSLNKDAESELTDMLEAIDVTLTEMTPFNSRQSAFDIPADATSDAANVGTFETTDIDGNAYTESVFGDYDLTLVNAFTTWCSPCVNEMPELEELYQEMKDQGVGVVGMVVDSVDADGNADEDVVKKAQTLKEKTGVTYPLLIPDKGNLNGRISGLQSFPESFFVDKEGNIVGEAILGSNNLEGWKEAVEKQLEEIKAGK